LVRYLEPYIQHIDINDVVRYKRYICRKNLSLEKLNMDSILSIKYINGKLYYKSLDQWKNHDFTFYCNTLEYQNLWCDYPTIFLGSRFHECGIIHV